ncbi:MULTISPECIES: YjfB family protein [Gracilibacillus]|uniref:YjfB family protein n=1 Tax=Gracilibacillus TaxID=74385 RepID=UPI000826D5A2|nr:MULTISPECIES: YjfB family protein [Gracilibacillus]
MDIAALSILMNQSQVQQQKDIALMSKAMDQVEAQSNDMIKLMESSVQPHLGGNIDLQG